MKEQFEWNDTVETRFGQVAEEMETPVIKKVNTLTKG